MKLDKPALIGATIFREGVDWETVIKRAQREYEYHQSSALQPHVEREAADLELMRLMLESLEHLEYCGICGEDSFDACDEGRLANEAIAKARARLKETVK